MSQTPDIVVYSSGWCPYCHRARKLLEGKGVEFEVIDVDFDSEQRRTMHERSGRTSVPQIFIGDTHVGGSDDLVVMERTGALDELLGLTGPGH